MGPASDTQLLHHDIERLPNGNVLMTVWETKTADEAIAAGRDPVLQGDRDLRPDFIVEVKPTGKTSGEIVWEWHIWDHLIQDRDGSKENHGDVAAHPELIDANYTEGWAQQLSEKEAEKLRSLGYLGPAPAKGKGPGGPDWTHTNAIAYNAELDQIVLTVHAFHEIWIVDHSTTSAEAAGHSGGRGGKGGDLLYRWGNPRAYRAGTRADQRLFAQHGDVSTELFEYASSLDVLSRCNQYALHIRGFSDRVSGLFPCILGDIEFCGRPAVGGLMA